MSPLADLFRLICLEERGFRSGRRDMLVEKYDVLGFRQYENECGGSHFAKLNGHRCFLAISRSNFHRWPSFTLNVANCTSVMLQSECQL